MTKHSTQIDFDNRIIREGERAKLTGLSRSTWWRLEQAGAAPQRIPLSESAHGWALPEIVAWIEAKKASRKVSA
jgi:prophage regulatory protein